MKFTSLVSAILIAAIAVDASAQNKPKKKPAPKQKWRVQQLHRDNNEGIAVGDIDGDGRLHYRR